jgi:hypothetical protein
VPIDFEDWRAQSTLGNIGFGLQLVGTASAASPDGRALPGLPFGDEQEQAGQGLEEVQEVQDPE